MKKTKKIRRLMKAAKMGKVRAMYCLALRYNAGCGVPQDADYAFYWMLCASEADYAPAVAWVQDNFFDDDALVQANA